MIRLKDVAARAGVSLMTVSKVLRNAPDVSQETKLRVRRLAEEMGYVPDALARGLRTRRTRLLGLIIPSIVHPVVGQVAAAIEYGVSLLGFDLLIAQSQDDLLREEAAIRKLLSRRIDGLFLYPVYRLAPTAPVYEELHKSGTPTVLLGQRAPFCPPFTGVEMDDVTPSSELTRLLIKLGHRRIAFLAGSPAAPWAQERFEGYRKALREAELPLDDRLVFATGPSIEEGAQAAQQMLNEQTGATAIQAVSDLVAVGVAKVLKAHGLRVPEDISLTGFGNYLVGEHGAVPLTTVQQPRQALGAAAVDVMQSLLKGHKPESRRLAAEVILRASCAPAQRSARLSSQPASEWQGAPVPEDDLQ